MKRRLQELIAEEERQQSLDQEVREEVQHQTHVHRFQESAIIAQVTGNPHNHRFSGVTGQAISEYDSHYHNLEVNTDSYHDHAHVIAARTGPATPVGNGKHIHLVEGQTTTTDGHKHEYVFGTLVEKPI